MISIVGVRFKPVGKIYYFDPDNQEISKGTPVIVETVRGIEYGTVEIANRGIHEEFLVNPLKKVIRIATEEDTKKYHENKNKEDEALEICKEKAKKHGLEMQLLDVEFTFDLSKVIFYFTAEGRVDFRELVKDLASIFRTRIELRQIGVRDEAKLMNGLGICGNTLCCATFLSEFQPVSIKMAKDQNLSLKPSKISGLCGRLMCCLKYEEDTYLELNKIVPQIGDIVETCDGTGEVLNRNLLRKTVKVAIRNKEKDDIVIDFYDVDDIKVVKHKRKGKNSEEKLSAEELAELKSIAEETPKKR